MSLKKHGVGVTDGDTITVVHRYQHLVSNPRQGYRSSAQGSSSHHGSGKPLSSSRLRTKVCHTTRVSPVEAEFYRFDGLGMSGIAFSC